LLPWEIATLLKERGFQVSKPTVRKLFRKHGYVRRRAHKDKTHKSHPDRDKQFKHIGKLRKRFKRKKQPVVSLDSKKKELLGTFYRDGKLYTQEAISVNDHDFVSYATGKVVPHGIYDVTNNKAHINIGLSADTSEFSCDSFLLWWRTHGVLDYPEATEILILADGGGSNAANSNLVKVDLQRFADETGLKLTVAHYPPYCSKHNPIEHRVFPHVTRACQGVVFESVEIVEELIAKTTTTTGLRVTTAIIDKVYETGRKVSADVVKAVRITRDKDLPRWNYTIAPNAAG
jgi:hypothetical protein